MVSDFTKDLETLCLQNFCLPAIPAPSPERATFHRQTCFQKKWGGVSYCVQCVLHGVLFS